MNSLSGLLLVCGASLFCLGAAMFYRRIKFYRNSKQTTGKVIEYERNDLRPILKNPVVEFYVSRSNKITFKSKVESNEENYSIGEEVAVRYLVRNPQIAEINKGWIIWFDVPLCFIFSFVLLWLGTR